MDKSLDDIISDRPKGQRRRSGRGGAARASVLGAGRNAPSPVHKAKAQGAAPQAAASPSVSAQKIIVSNLPHDVTEPQIKELFTSTVGPLRTVELSHDAKGHSKGIASIVFSRAGDGQKAYNMYNSRLIDGKRAMKIEIIVDPARAVPLSSRVAPAPQQQQPANNPTPKTARGGAAKRGRGRGGARRAERPAKSAADLDAEMEDYTSATNATPAPAAMAA